MLLLRLALDPVAFCLVVGLSFTIRVGYVKDTSLIHAAHRLLFKLSDSLKKLVLLLVIILFLICNTIFFLTFL